MLPEYPRTSQGVRKTVLEDGIAPRKKQVGKKTAREKRDLKDCRHDDAKRKNNPEVGLLN